MKGISSFVIMHIYQLMTTMPKEIFFFLTLFFLVMATAVVVAYARPSNSTGQDVVKLDLLRKSLD